MAFSIRTKLTFWYVSLLLAGLLTFGAVFTYSLYDVFIKRTDDQIGSLADIMAQNVITPSGEIFLPRNFDIILERYFGIRTSGNYIQVLDVHGGVVEKSSNLEGMRLPISEATYSKAVEGQTTFEDVRKVWKYPVRIVTRPIISNDGRFVGIVQVGSSLEGFDEIFHSLAYILLIEIIASVVIAGVVGFLLARKALKPVSDIINTTRRIGAENLNERLDASVPQDEIGRLATTINEMIERLEKSFRQVRQFTADASHELKTPLTVLKGEMEVALRAKDDPEYMRETIASSLEEIDRMSKIVMNLLDLAKMDVERGVASKTKIDTAKVLGDRFEHFKKMAADKQISFDAVVIDGVFVMGDPVMLGRLFYNLIENAIKYTERGGRVDVRIEKTDVSAVIAVSDTGLGISKEDLPFVFDRFFRVDKVRTYSGGAGLGLSICKEIAVHHGGDITVTSVPGKGSAFIVTLPLAD